MSKLKEPHVTDYCQSIGLEPTADGFVEQLRQQLKTAIQTFDDAFPTDDTLIFDVNNRLTLKRLAKQAKPDGLDELEHQLQTRLPDRQILDVLSRVHGWFPFTRHFGPASGSQTKMPDADARYY